MAVAARLGDDEITLIDNLTFEQPKTREMAAVLKALNLTGRSLLVAVPGYDVNVYKSIRNLDRVSVIPVAELNALNVLAPQRLLMTPSALDALREKAPVDSTAK
jgi:large subunit ribosomal protein L4